MAALPSDRVYQGFWIDFSQGPVLGATITTTADNANLVIAILSLLVAFTGAHLWDLIAFADYYMHISQHDRPAFYHQRQFLARNLTSPGAFALEMVKVMWGWRRHRPWLNLAPMTLLAVICSVGFLAAGIFVSLVVSSSSIQVLAQSTSCGLISWRNESTDLSLQYQQAVLSQALIYSQACYNKTGDLPQCDLYAQRNIPIQHAVDVECPFPGLCTNHSRALSLDTGLLDSDTTFGINAPSNLRVQMQRIITCAPLNASQFFSARPIPPDVLKKFHNRSPLPGEQLYEWSMGLFTAKDRPYNSTFWMSNYTSAFSNLFDLTPRASYAPIKAEPSLSWHNSTFNALSIFQKEFADTHILAVQNNGVRFRKPNNDPLFAAHRGEPVMFDDNSVKTMYTGDSPATFLGCTEQFRFCFSQGYCTTLLGVDQAFYEAQKIAPTLQQNVTLRYMFQQTPTWYSITTAPMQVTKNSISFQLGVPADQWKVEMFAWLDFLLAIAQSSITHLAAGPGIAGTGFDRLAEPLESSSICHNQRMGAPDGYSNINVLGLAVIIGLSAAVIITNLTLVPTLKCLHRCNRGRFPRIRLWMEDGMLQVQRKAYEGIGYCGWSSTDSEVPTMHDNPIPALSMGKF